MQWQKYADRYLIVLARGERVMASLSLLAEMEQIDGGTFWGLGAVDEAELAVYDVPAKKYHQQKCEGVFEVTNVSGTIGMLADKRIVHAHLTLADEQLRASGGHLVEGRVSGTMEIELTVWPKLTKRHDETTGLNVFELEQQSSA